MVRRYFGPTLVDPGGQWWRSTWRKAKDRSAQKARRQKHGRKAASTLPEFPTERTPAMFVQTSAAAVLRPRVRTRTRLIGVCLPYRGLPVSFQRFPRAACMFYLQSFSSPNLQGCVDVSHLLAGRHSWRGGDPSSHRCGRKIGVQRRHGSDPVQAVQCAGLRCPGGQLGQLLRLAPDAGFLLERIVVPSTSRSSCLGRIMAIRYLCKGIT